MTSTSTPAPTPDADAPPDGPLVTGVYNQFASVLVDGEEREATIAGRLRHARPVVGDRVELRALPDGSLRIERVLPRHGTLQRSGFRGRQQVFAANVALLVVVAALADPPLRPRLIDRYLVAAWRGGIDPAPAPPKAAPPPHPGDVPPGRPPVPAPRPPRVQRRTPPRGGGRAGAGP